MSYQIKTTTTAYPLVFLMVQSGDHRTGATGLSPTVTLSKAGGAFASPAGAVSEIANGWYKVAGNATDTGTLGSLVLHATSVGADDTDVLYEVVAHDVQDAVRLGMTAVPNVASGSAGGLIIQGTGTTGLDVTSGKVDVGKVNAVSTSSVTTINANQGTTQPENFTGTGASALVKVDAVDIAGAAVSTASAQIGVNIINAAGTAWNSGAIGASTLATDTITAAKIAADAIGASELAADALTEIRDAITGGAYALSTDANGRIRIVDGTSAGEIDTSSGAIAHVVLTDTVTTNTDMLTTAAIWQDTTAAHFTTALSIGKSIMNGVSLGTGLTINGYTGNTPQTGDAFLRIGANGVSLSAIPDEAGVTTLLSRLSATRAGYLDNLSAGAVALASALATVQSDTDDIQTRIPAALTSNGNMKSSLLEIISTTLSEGATGRLAAAWQKGWNVAASAWTSADINQTGDAYLYLTTNMGALGANLTAADDAVITAIAALNNLSQANIRTAVGLASANLDTQLAALPTATSIRNAVTGGAYPLDTDANGRIRIVDGTGTGEIDTTSGGVAVTPASVRSAVGIASANLDTQLGTLATTVLLTAVQKVLEADLMVDTNVSPWDLVYLQRGTATELLRKNLTDVSGNPITATTTVVGNALQ